MSKQGGWPATGFGDRLRVLRAQAGLTQKQLAERAACHPMTLAKLERGVQEPAWPLVLALARALGVSCQDFTPEAATAAPLPEKRGPGRPPKRSASATPADAAPRKPGQTRKR
jgi:putative transcriptional regulator